MIAGESAVRVEAGRFVGVGSYGCGSCGMRLEFDGVERISRCPGCGGTSFRRTPLFEQESANGIDRDATLERATLPAAPAAPPWLGEARQLLPGPGHYLAHRTAQGIELMALPIGWSRLGRSANADLRLDDPTVSRRHALLVRTREGEVRVLDDRSLNGIRVNGEKIEWGSLADGDELTVGRFRLYVLEREPTGSREPASALSAGG